jgi:hypothetical protein
MLKTLNQKPEMAEDRSILLAAIVLIYMLVYGHNMPSVLS